MSEVQHRPPPPARGRGGSSRGGRTGASFGTRGGAGRNSRTNGDNASPSFEDQGEVGMLKKQYSDQLKTLKEVISHWSDEDLVFALQETNGDVGATITRITDGHVTQFSEVKKKSNKDRARTKPNESSPNDSTLVAGRGGRGRGISEAPRGGRGGRGTDRGGRVAGRGRGGVGANGHKSKDSSDDITGDLDEPIDSNTGTKTDTEQAAPSTAGLKPGSEPKKPAATPWANLFKPAPAPVVKKPSPPPAPPQQHIAPPLPPQEQQELQQLQPQQPAPQSPPPQEEEPQVEQEPEPVAPPTPPAIEPAVPEQEELALPQPATPPELAEAEPPAVPEIKTEEPIEEISQQQPLTEKNLELIEDVAPPAPTGTQASTVNTSVPARSLENIHNASPTPQTRPATIGLPTPSHKISSGRTSSFTRRTLDQQEPVIMPGNHAIDRAIVQFGSLGLNGSIDDLDMDDEKEEPETVSQPPAPSPLPQPVAALPAVTPQVSLPPQQQQQQQQAPNVSEPLPTPRQAPGLPAQPQMQAPAQQQSTPQPPLAPQNMNIQQQQPLSSRFAAAEPAQQAQKSYDSFHHLPQQQQQPQHTPQAQPAQLPQQVPPVQPQQSQQQSYGYTPASYTQHQQQAHQQTHPLGGVSDQYQNYYTSDLQRVGGAPGLNYYSNPYSQPSQEAVASLPRAGSGLGTSADIPSQLPTAPTQAQQAASRFAAAQAIEQAGGHGTPSPGIPAPPSTQAPQPQQTAAHQQYPMQPTYYHPGYYYMNQQFYPYQQTPFGSKQQGIYSQPHQNFTPQYAEHTSSLAGLSGFGGPSSQGRETGAGLNDYGRAGVSQAQQSHPQHASTNFGGLPNFLNSRGLPEQQQLGSGVGQQQGGQQGQSEDNLKPFGDTKPPTGPASNPSLQGQPRPGSATSGAANLGPQQSAQQHAGMGYPAHLNHHLQGHHQQQPQHTAGAGQGYNYSMYGQYPSQYGQSNSRQTGGGSWGQYGH